MCPLVLSALLLLGCPGGPKQDTGQDSAQISDADEDGWSTAQDCNDRDASIHPDATELCDGVDNDCDEDVDEGLLITVWADCDDDGYGDAASSSYACGPGEGQAGNAEDCDDNDPHVHPGSDEICNTRDDDCDGTVDEQPIDGTPFHQDRDGDGYGDPHATVVACTPGDGLVVDATDCHDDDATAYPGSDAWEHPEDEIDQDCDGFDGTRDLDGDGLADLFIANYYDGESYVHQSGVFYGTADGFSAEADTFLETQGALGTLAEDLDGDGRVELVIASYYDGSSRALDSWVYWGAEGGPSTDDLLALPTRGAVDVLAEDLDGDGFPELVFAGYYDGDYQGMSRIHWSDGGTWDPESYTDLDTTGAWRVEAPDLDDDGFPELVFTSWYSSEGNASHASLFWNSSGNFEARLPVELPSIGSRDLAIADFDGDGYQDIALGTFRLEDGEGYSYGQASPVYWGSIEGYDTEAVTWLPTTGALDLEAADLNADGYADLVVACYRDDSSIYTRSWVFWGSMDGLSGDDTTALDSSGTRDVEVADLDGDGWLDLTFGSYYGTDSYDSESTIYWGSMDGFSAEDTTSLPTTGAWRVAAGDLDHDGWQDLVFTSYYGGASYSSDSTVYYGSKGGFSTEHRDLLATTGPWERPLLVGAD
jgi:hypothetical protein